MRLWKALALGGPHEFGTHHNALGAYDVGIMIPTIGVAVSLRQSIGLVSKFGLRCGRQATHIRTHIPRPSRAYDAAEPICSGAKQCINLCSAC